MILTNIDTVPGKKIVDLFGIVQGSTVRARHVGSDIAAGFKNMVGGELKGYTQLLEDARAESLHRLEKQADLPAHIGSGAGEANVIVGDVMLKMAIKEPVDDGAQVLQVQSRL